MCLRVSFLQALAKSYAEMAVDHARLKAPHQPSRPHWEQPIEAPQLATLLNVVLRLVQIVPSRGTTTSEIRDAIRAYSIAVTPS